MNLGILAITTAPFASATLIFWLATGLLPIETICRVTIIVLVLPFAVMGLLLAVYPWRPAAFRVTGKGFVAGYLGKWKHVKWCQILRGPVDPDSLKADYHGELPADGENDLLVFWRNRLLILPLPDDPSKQEKVLRLVSERKPVEQADPSALQEWHEARHREAISKAVCFTPLMGQFALAMVFLLAGSLLRQNGFPIRYLVVGGIGLVLLIAMGAGLVIALAFQSRRPKLPPPTPKCSL
ncbi:MAG: hypothetical protein ACOCVI_02555 [Planctomycetota bacterium]